MSTVKGMVERIVHRSEQTGYTVMELSSQEELITLVGIMPQLEAGETIEAVGSFVTHSVYGDQFSVESLTVLAPENAQAIERYLASGAIRGIGPALAARIVARFGEETLDVMETDPKRLAQIKGISKAGAEAIRAQMLEKREMRDALIFLGQYGISLSLAVKIFERYGQELYTIIRTNPYRLADEISRVGFRVADNIARQVGIAQDDAFRIRSGLLYALTQALEAGHIFLPRRQLIPFAAQLLEVEEAPLERALFDLALEKRVMLREIHVEDPREARDYPIPEARTEPVVYLTAYYYMETAVAAMLCALNHPLPLRGDVEKALAEIEKSSKMPLEDLQHDAVRSAIERGVTVITGGPGTGKTTTIATLIRYFEQNNLTVELAAPTGRAAKRITEATGHDAKTIHRLLEFVGAPTSDREEDSYRFQRTDSNPLEADVVIIDECSMVDLPLMYALLKAIVPGTRFILVGDANQLPSVGPGNVLKDILASGIIPAIELTRIFRQAEESDIVLNAHRIHRGEQIDPTAKSRDFLFIRPGNIQGAQQAVVRLVQEKLPPYIQAAPWEIQVITPSRKGVCGVENLNKVLQEHLNPPAETKKERKFLRGCFRQGDKLMQIKNNYQKEWVIRNRYGVEIKSGTGIFNGDIGVLKDIRFYTEELLILFDDDREAVYSFSEAEELELAYAVTVHKSQGSEYPAVVIPLVNVPLPLMTRNLIYTAVTRARKCVCIVGSPTVFQQMVDNDTEQKRYSSLAEQLTDTAARGTW